MFLPKNQLLERLGNTKNYLILANIFLVFILILLSNLDILPLQMGDFVFFTTLILAFALYRPGWAFLFFIGTIALENIDLAPEKLGITLRPYQLIGGLLFLSVAVRFFSKKLYFKPAKLNLTDYLIFLIPLAGLLNLFKSPNPGAGLKFALILFSFTIIYLLTKNYIQNIYDLKKSLSFFFGATLIVILYGFWQNIRFSRGLNSFSVMPGRPNATLTEPDWLGLFLIVVIAGIYALIYLFTQKTDLESKLKRQLALGFSYLYLILAFALIILSVSRSAWIGVIVMTGLFLFAIFTDLRFNFRSWQWKITAKIKLGIIGAFLIALSTVYILHLTTFQLWSRAVSSGGVQKITISCLEKIVLPEKILAVEELSAFNCRHINLEEIGAEKEQGRFVTEIDRNDPNVSVRAEVYGKGLLQLKMHPILGIGWENIPLMLGKDARGVSLNSSNIFLETYLGSGILGFLSLVMIFSSIFIQTISVFFREKDLEKKAFVLFVMLSGIGIIIFNFFNAGIMLGFFWVWLAIASVPKSEKLPKDLRI